MNGPTNISRPTAHRKSQENPADATGPKTKLPATTISNVEAQLENVDEMIAVEQTERTAETEATTAPSIVPTTRHLTYAIRSMGLSSINSLAFTIFVTQVGWLGVTTGAWFLIGSMIGHGIGLITILQLNRN